MATVQIEGGNPLIGTVYVSGAQKSAIRLLIASIFSNETITFSNVPKSRDIIAVLGIIQQLGGKVEWLENNVVQVNCAGINSYEIPSDLGALSRATVLFAGPLLFRFGKARIPMPDSKKTVVRPINRLVDTWEALGIRVTQEGAFIELVVFDLKPAVINFKIISHLGTDNALLCAASIIGETTITNAAQNPEVDELIEVLNILGAQVERTAERTIRVNGSNQFKAGEFHLPGSVEEAVMYAIGAYLTRGNLTIKGVDKNRMLSFAKVLSSMGCKYEFNNAELRVWSTDEELLPINITTSAYPGFMSEWLPNITLLLTQAKGESFVHETVYIDKFDFTKELNRMGANIELVQPSSLGITPIIGDDSYDVMKFGEPYTVTKIHGPTKLRGTRLNVTSVSDGEVLLLAALAAKGRSEISGYEHVESKFENVTQKFLELDARITDGDINF